MPHTSASPTSKRTKQPRISPTPHDSFTRLTSIQIWKKSARKQHGNCGKKRENYAKKRSPMKGVLLFLVKERKRKKWNEDHERIEQERKQKKRQRKGVRASCTNWHKEYSSSSSSSSSHVLLPTRPSALLPCLPPPSYFRPPRFPFYASWPPSRSLLVRFPSVDGIRFFTTTLNILRRYQVPWYTVRKTYWFIQRIPYLVHGIRFIPCMRWFGCLLSEFICRVISDNSFVL